MKVTILSFCFSVLFQSICCALGPHEVLVIVNTSSPDSVEIGKRYCRMRDIPDLNLVRVRLPDKIGTESIEISPDLFTRYIWSPVKQVIAERGLESGILAWVYSSDFPLLISTNPNMSIQGITFVRNRIPPGRIIKAGQYDSPLFTGPKFHGGQSYHSQTFGVYRDWLREGMPLPSMLLGYLGERGNSKEEVMSCLKNGKDSDYTSPSGTVYFVMQDDIRSTCRDWQFSGAAMELKQIGIDARVVDGLPSGAKGVMGLMIGKSNVSPDSIDSYRPGCMAEHLTSAAGIFKNSGQTKLSEWIKSGVSASAGTVTEPFAIWTKFPSACFYVHYAKGCTMIESFYQSIRSPLQLIIVGDPLATPWATKGEIQIEGLPEDEISGILEINVSATDSKGAHYSKFAYLIDGRLLGEEKSLSFDSRKFKDGVHELRVVAYRTGMLRNQIFRTESIRIENR